MTDHKRNISDEINVTSLADYTFSKANCVQIWEDLKHLISKYRDENLEPTLRNVTARVAIVFMAFYFESLANALFDKGRKNDEIYDDLKNIDPNKHIPSAIRKFRSEYRKTHNKDIQIDIKGIQDLFTIRNNIFAHAKERTTIAASDKSKITELNYLKYVGFPCFYADFGYDHAEELLHEMKGFLKIFATEMEGKIEVWLQKQLMLDE